MMRMQRQGRIGFYLSCIGEEAAHIRHRARAARRRLDLHRLPRDRRRALPRLPAAHLHVPDVRQRRGSGEGAADAGAPLGAEASTSCRSARRSGRRSRTRSARPGRPSCRRRTTSRSASSARARPRRRPSTSARTSRRCSRSRSILICRNNGWAISVPRSVQTASPTFAQKAVAYGMPGVLVDGNDVLAMIHVVREAAARARRGEGATLIEARTYRRGAHSTSDDPSVYRDPAEPKEWESRDPLDRLRAYMKGRGELPDGFEAQVQQEATPGDPRRDRRRRARRRQAAARQPVRGRLRRRPLAPARAAGRARGRAAQARRKEAAARRVAPPPSATSEPQGKRQDAKSAQNRRARITERVGSGLEVLSPWRLDVLAFPPLVRSGCRRRGAPGRRSACTRAGASAGSKIAERQPVGRRVVHGHEDAARAARVRDEGARAHAAAPRLDDDPLVGRRCRARARRPG